MPLWHEFEEGKTNEARLVRELDVIEMAWQAKAYQESGRLSESDAGMFIESARSRVSSPTGLALLQAIL
jgi:5'-deoxynucleotidase YfbR-like HD superfamily hydrolase